MLSGRYPSDEFAELRPRITWDRLGGHARAAEERRSGWRCSTAARSPTAGCTACTSPATAGSGGTARRRARRGDGVRDARRRRVSAGRLVVAGAGDHARPRAGGARRRASRARCRSGAATARGGRSISAGRSASCRGSSCARRATRPRELLQDDCRLDAQATDEPAQLRRRPGEATGELPSDQCIVVESFLDELGDWRTVVLSPFGSRVHAPWAIAVGGAAAGRDGARSRLDVGRRRHGVPPAGERAAAAGRAAASRRRRRSKTRSFASWARRRCSPPGSARTPPGRCCCRGGSRSIARRCGCSGASRPTCWRSRRGTSGSRSCSKRTASACATCSTCRGSSSCWPTSSGSRFASTRSRRAPPRRSPRR